MTGSTSTSLWTHYSNGAREYCGNTFPDGMRKNERLAKNVITPTTKAEDHDEPINPTDIVARGLMSQVCACVGGRSGARGAGRGGQGFACSIRVGHLFGCLGTYVLCTS